MSISIATRRFHFYSLPAKRSQSNVDTAPQASACEHLPRSYASTKNLLRKQHHYFITSLHKCCHLLRTKRLMRQHSQII